MEKIVFFSPRKGVSPNPIYLCGLADQLADDRNFEVYYIDYVNGASSNLLANYRVRKYAFIRDSYNMEIFPDEPVTFIAPIDLAMNIPKLHPESKVIFINWHRECVPSLCRNWKTQQNDKDKLLELIHQRGGVIFTDQIKWQVQNRLTGLQHRDTFVPYITNFREPTASPELISQTEYNIAIWGGLYADTVYPAVELLSSISDLSLDDKTVNVHIIGTGSKKNILFNRNFPAHINLIKHETMTDEEAVIFLSENVDIVFAQRQYALNAGMLGLPTIILPEGNQYFRCNRYVFLHQNSGYALRWTPDELEKLGLEYVSVDEIFNEVYTKNQKASIGSECRSYVIHNHTENVSFLIHALEQCSLRYEVLHPLIRPCTEESVSATKVVSLPQKILNMGKKIIGKPVRQYCLFGIPFFTLRCAYEDRFNLFLLGCIPLLRIQIQNKLYNANILLFVWVRAFFRILLANRFGKKSQSEQKSQDQIKHRKLIQKKLSRGEKIKICLFVSRLSCWNFERLYDILEKSPYFEPTVVVKPFMHQGYDAMVNYMEETYHGLSAKGYRILKGYDKETNQYLDLRKTLNPDILFYTKYWLPQFHPNFYISNFRDKITFYTSYCFDIADHPAVMNFELNNTVDRYFMASQIHKRMAEQVMDNGGRNVYVTGAPKLDMLLDPDYCAKPVWKEQSKPKKRIIWAPHHSDAFPGNMYQFNAFFELYEFMLDVAIKYQDSIQIAFKPHPMLKPKLDEKWGKSAADAYYKKWAELENGQLETGEFIDLFKTSDAMIMDSISFIAEYTAVNKPALFTIGKQTRVKLNDFGIYNFDVLYNTKHSLFEDIIYFIEDVVIAGNDPKKEEREAFIKEYMAAPNKKDAAQCIYENICEEVFGEGFVDEIQKIKRGEEKWQ